MSRTTDKPGRTAELKRLRKKVRKVQHSPCGRPPIVPTDLDGVFDRAEPGRHIKLRANLSWAEVGEDTSGFSLDIRHYLVHVQYTTVEDPDEGDWLLAGHHVSGKVKGELDDDSNNRAHYIARALQSKVAYRFRVNAVSVDGCKSGWTDWYVLGVAAANTPPAPTNVKVHEISRDRIVYKWAASLNNDDSDLFHDDINHFGVEISQHANFSSIYDIDRGVKGQHVSFKIADADLVDGDGVPIPYYGRAWSVSPDKDKSVKIPATIAGNDAEGGTPDAIYVDAGPAVGTIRKSSASAIPAGWLRCNGQAVSRSTYAQLNALYAAGGYPYGNGNGSTTFNVPDHRERHPAGAGSTNALGATAGADDEATRDLGHGPHASHGHSHQHDSHTSHNDHGSHATGGGATVSGGGGHGHGAGGLTATDGGAHNHGPGGLGANSAGNHGHSTAGSHGHGSGSIAVTGPSTGGDLFRAGTTSTFIASADEGHHHNSSTGNTGNEPGHGHGTDGAHPHSVSGDTGGQNAAHGHGVGGTVGSVADHGHYNQADHAHDAHGTHGNHGSHATNSVAPDSPVDETGSPTGKGHKKHPRIHFHYNVKY